MSGPADPGPPPWAELLVGLLVPRAYRDDHLGDLREGWTRRARDPQHHADARRARRWYWSQALRSVPALVRLRLRRAGHTEPEGAPMETIAQDLVYGLRSLRKNPAFALVSTVTLALAIGVNTAIFSLVSVVVFAELPMNDADGVALIRSVNAELGIDQGTVSPADYLDLVERNRSFVEVVALQDAHWVLTGGDAPLRIPGSRMSVGLTGAWRLPPSLGRSFADDEGRPGGPRVAMLSHSFWQDRYGGSPDVLGETLELDGDRYTVVGVMHPGFEFSELAEPLVHVPLVLERGSASRAQRSLLVSGRLADGVTHEQATQDVDRISRELAAEHPEENAGWGIWSASVRDGLVADDGKTILLLLQLTVSMVILIACANVANMLLARATARVREMAVRSALGAGRGRLIRQLLTESLVISLAAAALGVGLAKGLNEALIWISAGTEAVFRMTRLDGRVLGFTLMVSLVAPLLFGLLPALTASAPAQRGALREGRFGDGGRSGARTRTVLVGAQVSLALALMVVASLLTRTVAHLQTRPLGVDPEGLITVELGLSETRYPDDESRRIFFARAREALDGIAALEQPALVRSIPAADFGARRSIAVVGRDEPAERARPSVYVVAASPDYFDLVGIPLVRGRSLLPSDDAETPGAVVLSRETAERFWPGEDPLGQSIHLSGEDRTWRVVGVVGDVRGISGRPVPDPLLYVAHAQTPVADMYVVARTTAEPSEIAGPIRAAIASVDPDQPVDRIRTMERAQYENAATDYALLTLFGTFAVFALFMSAIGIYGVMSYSVSQRGAEIGLRMALGASGRAVRSMVVAQGLRVLLGGVAVGLLAAFALSRLIAGLVVGISPTDPISFVLVPTVLVGVALLANLVPAMRATRLDPADTLRSE